jgi:hypothetical protein
MNVLWPLKDPSAEKLSDLDIVDRAHAAFCAEWVKAGGPNPAEMGVDEIAQYSPRTPPVAKEMLYSYLVKRDHLFKDPTFRLLAVERPFALPLDPDDDKLWYVGRLDKVFSVRSYVYCGEHKSTTSYRTNGPFRTDFLESFSPNSQIDGYLYALRSLYGAKARAVWVDAALVHKTVHDGFTLDA